MRTFCAKIVRGFGTGIEALSSLSSMNYGNAILQANRRFVKAGNRIPRIAGQEHWSPPSWMKNRRGRRFSIRLRFHIEPHTGTPSITKSRSPAFDDESNILSDRTCFELRPTKAYRLYLAKDPEQDGNMNASLRNRRSVLLVRVYDDNKEPNQGSKGVYHSRIWSIDLNRWLHDKNPFRNRRGLEKEFSFTRKSPFCSLHSVLTSPTVRR